MASFNKVILAGNVTRDPELRDTPSGMAVATFGLAINRKFKAKDGEQREEVTFVDVTAFDKQAEVVGKWFAKGKPVLVEGRLKFDQWEDKQGGGKRSKLSVVLESFQFIGGPKSEDDGGGKTHAAPVKPLPQDAAYTTGGPAEEEIPF